MNSIGAWLSAYWMWLVIGTLGLVVVVGILTRKKGVQYHDQIKENKELFTKELEMNKTEIRSLVYKDRIFKVVGERWLGRVQVQKATPKQSIYKELTEFDLKQRQLESIKAKIKGTDEPEIIAWKFLVKVKYIDLKLYRLYLGKSEIIYLSPADFTQIDSVTMRINDSVRLMYEKGVFIPMRISMIDLVSEETERVMKDLEINAQGKQQKDIARLDIDYAHKETMKEKDIEAEKEKKKAVSYG